MQYLSSCKVVVQVNHHSIYASIVISQNEAAVAVWFEEAVRVVPSESDALIHSYSNIQKFQ